MNPNKPFRGEKRGNKFWADANGIGEYIVYNNGKTHACTKEASKACKSTTATNEPFHPHYGLLIEYFADTFLVEPSELHFLVVCLDEEVRMQVGRQRDDSVN